MNHVIGRHAANAPRKYHQLPRLFRWFSEHCVLRSAEESDVMHLWNAASHPHFERCWSGPVPRSLDDVTRRVHRAQAEWNGGQRYALAVQRKATQEFVGWIELVAHASRRGAWLLQWFVHPRYVADPIGRETVAAASELMFATLDTQHLYATNRPAYGHFSQWLNDCGFIEIAAAGTVDPTTQRRRTESVFELGRTDWERMRGTAVPHCANRGPATLSPATQPRIELALV